MDDELRRLCKDIYWNNKEVIDMVYTVGNAIDIEPAVAQFATNTPDIVLVSQKNTTVWFGIKEFTKSRRESQDSWGGGFPICFWFSEYYGKLKLTLEVGPFDDPYKRIGFLNTLEACGVKIRERSKEPERKYTRIYTQTLTIKDWGDQDEVYDGMKKLYEKDNLQDIKRKAIEAVDAFQW